MSNNPAAHFLSDNFTFLLSVFDTRRGDQEGDEYEKVLSFYPTTAALTIRTSIVGLAQAISTFPSNFAEDDGGHKIMEGEFNRWVMLPCEPGVWMLMVVNKAWVGRCCANVALHAFLARMHTLFVLLHGRVNKLLEQCLVNQLLITPRFGSRLVSGVMLTWHSHLLWSSLQAADTGPLFQLSQRIAKSKVGPAGVRVAAGAHTERPFKAGGTAPLPGGTPPTLLSPQQWQAGPAHRSPTSAPGTTASSGGLNSYTSSRSRVGNFMVPVLSTRAPTTEEPRAVAAAGGSHPPQGAVIPAAHIWLQASEEWAVLLPYQSGPLQVMMVLQHSTVISEDVLAILGEVLSRWCGPLSTLLNTELPGHNLWHEPGFRYSYSDSVCDVSRASPAKKITTLSPQSQRVVAEVRNSAEVWARQAGCGKDASGAPGSSTARSSQDQDASRGDMELVVRSRHDCWVVARQSSSCRLYVALEQPPEQQLLQVTQKVDSLCATTFAGTFT
ncbi:MAG: hypothetical protein WDW38_001429 [Sanguina aurantia]